MNIQTIESISPLAKRYETGEQPVLLDCSDGNSYVCKYGKSLGGESKLSCEFIGYALAKIWGLNTPDFAIVKIKAEHLYATAQAADSTPRTGIGSRFCHDVIDITDLSLMSMPEAAQMQKELKRIALFDMWVANEDRNINNYNLMYSVTTCRFVPIDFGCIFNTATFDYPLSQLTLTDSLLYSDLYRQMPKEDCDDTILQKELIQNVEAAKAIIPDIVSAMPAEWRIQAEQIGCKLIELCSDEWVTGVWKNYIETINETA